MIFDERFLAKNPCCPSTPEIVEFIVVTKTAAAIPAPCQVHNVFLFPVIIHSTECSIVFIFCISLRCRYRWRQRNTTQELIAAVSCSAKKSRIVDGLLYTATRKQFKMPLTNGSLIDDLRFN